MDDAARQATVTALVQDSDALADSIEVVRERVDGERGLTLAKWTDTRRGQSRRGAVDVAMTNGTWRSNGGWSSNADHDSDHPVWLAWGGTSRSMSGWVSDPGGVTIRVRDADGRVAVGAVEKGAAILIFDVAFGRGAMVEVLDAGGNVLRTAPLHRE